LQVILLLSRVGRKINKKTASGRKNKKGVVAAVSMVYDIHRRPMQGADKAGGMRARKESLRMGPGNGKKQQQKDIN
jgi:hypothetical protein